MARTHLKPLGVPFPSPSPYVRSYPFADASILHRAGSNRICALNDASAFIWCVLDEVNDLEELAGRLATAFSISRTRALRDAEFVLASFERENLLAGNDGIEIHDKDDSWDVTPYGPTLVEPSTWKVRRFFRASNHVFEFCCADTVLGEAFFSVMSHLEVDEAVPPNTRLAVLPEKYAPQTCAIYVDSLEFRGDLPRNMVLPHLAMLTFVRSCESLKERLLFHGAVLKRGERAVVFAGEAGSGKTTLTAALTTEGYQCFSDELAVLNAESLCVSPLPLPMSIKPGSVEPLRGYYPALADYPVHLRTDGKKVRYLSPFVPTSDECVDSSVPVGFLVFPKYREGAENRLTAIGKMEALRRLAKTGSSNRALTHRDVEAMISLVEKTPCFELVFAELSGAVSLLKRRVFASG
jgi:hypothetical protein